MHNEYESGFNLFSSRLHESTKERSEAGLDIKFHWATRPHAPHTNEAKRKHSPLGSHPNLRCNRLPISIEPTSRIGGIGICVNDWAGCSASKLAWRQPCHPTTRPNTHQRAIQLEGCNAIRTNHMACWTNKFMTQARSIPMKLSLTIMGIIRSKQ